MQGEIRDYIEPKAFEHAVDVRLPGNVTHTTLLGKLTGEKAGVSQRNDCFQVLNVLIACIETETVEQSGWELRIMTEIQDVTFLKRLHTHY